MTNKKGMRLLLTLGLVMLALVLLPGQSWARDGDGDGYDSKVDDCNDKDASVYPNAPELCDGIDNQCPGDVGYGTVDEGCISCTDVDGDGYCMDGTPRDCDDSNPYVHPGVPEYCNDNIDNNCDGFTNESCTACTDADNDGYYVEAACGTPQDCNDSNLSVNPGVLEKCETPPEVDDNCDGQVNEGCSVAGDSDGDGFSDSLENTGFELNTHIMFWNEVANAWDTSIPGYSDCNPGEKCLNPYKEDLFVIWRPLSPSESEIDLANCNIFEFANSPISNFTVWVLMEDPGFISTTRQITSFSDQKAVVLIEDPAMYGTTGFSQPGSIMVQNKGKAWIYSYQIVANVAKCGGLCDVNNVPMSDAEIECLHFRNTASHEIWHVLSALNTPDLHIADDAYIMYPATVLIEKKTTKTYTIGDEFSPSGLTDPKFQ